MKPNESLLYAATSANLYNFMGNSDFGSHMILLRSILQSSASAFRDLFDFSVERLNLTDPDDVTGRIKEEPCIFITFHTGSYYMLVSFLLKLGSKVVVMSDTQSVTSGDFDPVAPMHRERYGNECSLDLINVEEQGAIFNLIRKIRSGYITVAYIDGNKGIGGQTMQNENMVDVDLLNGKVKVRRGIAYLSFLAGVPLHLALHHEEDGVSCLRIYEKEQRVEGEDKEAFSRRVMQNVFRKFGEYLGNYYVQWANWPYVHNWSHIEVFSQREAFTVPPPVPAAGKSWNFNSFRFCPLKIDQGYYLFDRFGYTLLPVGDRWAGLFSYKTTAEDRKAMVEDILTNEKDMASDLISRNVLVEV